MEVPSEVVSSVAEVLVGMDVRVKLGDSRLNSGQIIWLFAGRTRFKHFCPTVSI